MWRDHKILFITLLPLALLSARVVYVQFIYTAEDRYFDNAKAAIKKLLKDPESAEFRNLRQTGAMVCGEVNARNSFGGYTGFKGFVAYAYEPSEKLAQIGGVMWEASCKE